MSDHTPRRIIARCACGLGFASYREQNLHTVCAANQRPPIVTVKVWRLT